MKLLSTIVVLDCITTFICINYYNMPEKNPVLSYIMDSTGLLPMLLFKLILTASLLTFIYKVAVKRNINYNKYCNYGSIAYIFLFIIGVFI